MSALKTSNIAIVIGIVMGILGGAVGVYAVFNSESFTEFMNSPSTEKWLPFLIIGIVFIPMILAFGPFILKGIENSKKKKRLMQIGQREKATVLNVQDTGLTINNNPYVQVTVQIHGTQAIFQITASRVYIPRPGDQIEVIYDPSDPTVVMAAPR